LGDRSYKAGTRWRADAPHLKLQVTAYSGEIKIELEQLPLDLAREVCALVRERLDAVATDGS
jgi:hypothetical protein